MSCSGNAIAAENETARPESRKYRASCRARHTVRRLEPRKNSTALDAQELTPRVRIPRRRTGVQGGVVSRNWCNNFHHKRRYGPAQAVLGTAVRRAKARSIFRRELRNGQSECAIVQVCDRPGPTFGRYVVAVGLEKAADALALVSKGYDYGQAFASVCRGQKSDLYRCSASARYPRPQPRWRQGRKDDGLKSKAFARHLPDCTSEPDGSVRGQSLWLRLLKRLGIVPRLVQSNPNEFPCRT